MPTCYAAYHHGEMAGDPELHLSDRGLRELRAVPGGKPVTALQGERVNAAD